MKFLFSFLFCLLFFSKEANAQFISVDENFTAQELVEDVLFSNSCGTVSNITVSGGNFDTGEKSWGYFNANGSGFPFTDGILLSTGKVINAIGPNDSLLEDGGNMNWNGDSDLNQALGLSNSFNATVLEFDFIPITNKISFDFILSSEQYLSNPTSNQCNFTDGFAFLLKDVNDTNYQNIALVPGTNIPVKINTIRGSGTICPPANEQYFDAFNGINHPTNFNGQTKSLKAEADVIAGNTYHIKLVLADEGNHRYDSAIFLKGGSFSFDIDLGQDRLISNGNPICFNEIYTLDATSFNATTYQWYYNGNLLTGETNPTLSFTPPYSNALNGTYSVIIDEGDTCERSGEIVLEFSAELFLNQTDYSFCDTDENQDGFTSFSSEDFNSLLPSLFTNLPSNYNVSFFENPNDNTPISFPFINTNAFQQTIYAKITNFNCYSPDAFPINLTINTFDEIIEDKTFGLCNGNELILETSAGYSYIWNTGETTQSIIVSQPGIYTVTLTDSNNCNKTQSFNVIGSEIATITNVLTTDFSNTNTAEIQFLGNGDYEFSIDGMYYQESAIFSNLDEGQFTAFVNDKNGCGLSTYTFFILNYPKFFTPNNDGINDYWKVKNLAEKGLEASKIYIFDRYGKLIIQISSENEGWNGFHNGVPMPSDDYWFILELSNAQTIKGHFALKR